MRTKKPPQSQKKTPAHGSRGATWKEPFGAASLGGAACLKAGLYRCKARDAVIKSVGTSEPCPGTAQSRICDILLWCLQAETVPLRIQRNSCI